LVDFESAAMGLAWPGKCLPQAKKQAIAKKAMQRTMFIKV
jgi:hypothetical protein